MLKERTNFVLLWPPLRLDLQANQTIHLNKIKSLSLSTYKYNINFIDLYIQKYIMMRSCNQYYINHSK